MPRHKPDDENPYAFRLRLNGEYLEVGSLYDGDIEAEGVCGEHKAVLMMTLIQYMSFGPAGLNKLPEDTKERHRIALQRVLAEMEE